ncbi:hypothetical protein [Lysinibacillus parviboronicapiens]|uniref:hypothetical protein n=1 Tax=Lysinibacillus parviboronicapiens TaxID=436516 RepID=UPI000D3D0A69|nr:hypothetical protein [Lysinibacillus parviboronicapiens]
MKFKHLFLGFIALIGLTYFTTQDASAQTIDPNSDEFISQVKIYDENGDQIPYTTEELKDMIQFTPEDSESHKRVKRSMKTTYDTNSFSFSSDIWIGGGFRGRAFFNPADTLITCNSSAPQLTVNAFYDDGNGGVTSNKPANSIELPGGWTGTVHMSSWTALTRGKSVRFKLTTSSKLARVDNIQVWYNWQG